MFVSASWVSIFLGVISGVVTTIILWLLKGLYIRVLLPHIEQMVYRGVNISGDWLHTDKSDFEIPKDILEKINSLKKISQKAAEITKTGILTEAGNMRISGDFEITLSIKQRAHRLNGYFRAKTKDSKKDYINYYRIEGAIKDNYATFNYNAERSDRTGMGSFLLRVANGGTQLIGSAIFTPDGSLEDTRIETREGMCFVKK